MAGKKEQYGSVLKRTKCQSSHSGWRNIKGEVKGPSSNNEQKSLLHLPAWSDQPLLQVY